MAEDTSAVVVAARVDDVPNPVIGSTVKLCGNCYAACWLSPASSRGLPLLCVQCASLLWDQSNAEVVITGATINEWQDWLERRKKSNGN